MIINVHDFFCYIFLPHLGPEVLSCIKVANCRNETQNTILFLSFLNIGLHIPHKHSPHIYQIINIVSEIYDHKYH